LGEFLDALGDDQVAGSVVPERSNIMEDVIEKQSTRSTNIEERASRDIMEDDDDDDDKVLPSFQ
jgi:hypothetical protein